MILPIKLPDSNRCCGCSACVTVCPVEAITLRPDHEGLLQPFIADELCRHCGLCGRSCPVLNVGPPRYVRKNGSWESSDVHVLAAKAVDEGIRLSSTSGGAASVLARRVIADGGVVFGVVSDSKSGNVPFARAVTRQELSAFRGAKYVQADPGDTYKQIRAQVRDSSAPVMFVGTPCQVAGLRCCLGQVPDNLVLVELVCHGVPSPLAWRRYWEGLGSRAFGVCFRSKRRGWKTHTMSVLDRDGRELLSHWRGYS